MKCRDHDEVCGNEADPAFTMDFTDVEPGAYIYWCSKCGPRANAMMGALDKAFATRPGFAAELETAINKHRFIA
jgi:hypothetical protein